ncbi:MAG: hypothetical protein SFV55_12765 [Haliscomenobacter sp.]|uniref:hypothetical protein n=1 Tax=Haliscomenobacter sp. TaxID=2717303 RepID=UPI0029BE8942|nr:hypothetical protein [Haliscomenobacter sp.]MDX2069289.1 hypothetical protein [Haliscomenobacter sp.]
MKAKHEDLMLEITSTLEQIQKVDELILFHPSFEEPDENALDNFNPLRDDFLQQLNTLMEDLNLELKWRG